MKNNLTIIASRLRGIAGDLVVLASQIEAEAPHLSVTLPEPDLFSSIADLADEVAAIESPLAVEPVVEGGIAPARRIYKRVGCKMRDDAIVAASKVGRAQGYCQRSDIERSLRREQPERTREEIREAVNKAVAELGLTCIIHNSYRYYRIIDRERLMAAARGIML